MPAKNSVKQYLENGNYHIYNRGVDKRVIFEDDQDYRTFLSLLKTYLSPPELILKEYDESPFRGEKPSRLKRRMEMNLNGKLNLVAYCLMPNHFHLLINQVAPRSMAQLIQRVCTSYSTYFNHKNDRSGSLFQGVYRAASIPDELSLLYISRYIHLNPIQVKKVGLISSTSGSPADYQYSSYHNYVNMDAPIWLNKDIVLDCFKNNKENLPANHASYAKFVEDYNSSMPANLDSLTLEQS